MKKEDIIKDLELNYGWKNLKEKNEFSWFVDGLLEDILSIVNTKDSKMLEDILGQQEEIISNPTRFNGVHVNKIMQLFKDRGAENSNPF